MADKLTELVTVRVTLSPKVTPPEEAIAKLHAFLDRTIRLACTDDRHNPDGTLVPDEELTRLQGVSDACCIVALELGAMGYRRPAGSLVQWKGG
jgi:hypothetical protein